MRIGYLAGKGLMRFFLYSLKCPARTRVRAHSTERVKKEKKKGKEKDNQYKLKEVMAIAIGLMLPNKMNDV